jgi:hypothetical protein
MRQRRGSRIPLPRTDMVMLNMGEESDAPVAETILLVG